MTSKNLRVVKKMGTENLQNGGPNPPKSSPNGAKRGSGRKWAESKTSARIKNHESKTTNQKPGINILVKKMLQHRAKVAEK